MKLIVTSIAIAVGLLHFVTGPDYQGPFPAFVNGYLIDILLPFAMFLVLGVAEKPLISGTLLRGLAVFLFGFSIETLQYFNIHVFGSTFDIFDYFMYASGILLGILFERIVLSGDPID